MLGARSLLLLIILLATSSVDAVSRSTAIGRVEDAKEYLQELMEDEDTRIPSETLKDAKGIVIMRQYKGGFIWGYKEGRGIGMVRKADDSWSPPAFLTSREGSVGLQIGGQSIDTIYLLMDKEGLNILSDSRMKIGVDAAAAAGPTGRSAEAKIGPEISVLAYSRSKGLFAGASIEGGAMVNDLEANEAVYDQDGLRSDDILYKDKVEMPAEGRKLADLLKSYE